MENNPLSEAKAIAPLLNALEQELRPGSHSIPPATGGDQISVRLDKMLLAHLDAIGTLANWTRVQVLTALIERGLFDLYDSVDDGVGKKIMEKRANFCFYNSLNPAATALIEKLEKSLASEPGTQVHCTYANGGDLRVRCYDGRNQGQNVVAISWQSRNQRFVCQAYTDPQACLELGATEATTFQHGPLESIAKFDVPASGDALIKVVHRSLANYRTDQTKNQP